MSTETLNRCFQYTDTNVERNHDEFLDRDASHIAEMDALIQETSNRIERETTLLARQKNIAALYKKRAVAKQEFESLRQELNSAMAKAERVNEEFMSWLNGVVYSHADDKPQNEKLASLSEAADECVRKRSQLNAKVAETQLISREIKLLEEAST